MYKPFFSLFIALFIISCHSNKAKVVENKKEKHSLLSQPSYAQNIQNIEKQLCKDLERVDYWSEQEYSGIASDSLENANIIFDKHILKALNTNEASLHYDFPLLSKKIEINTSPDKKLRSYSRNTYMGGTMRDFQTIFQYQGGNKIFAKKMSGMTEADSEVYLCEDLFSFDNSGTTIYISSLFMTESSMYFASGIKLFYINKNEIIPVNLINTENKPESELWVEYLNPYTEKQQVLPQIINFDPVTKKIKIAKTDDNLKLMNSYIIYEFNGSEFTKSKD